MIMKNTIHISWLTLVGCLASVIVAAQSGITAPSTEAIQPNLQHSPTSPSITDFDEGDSATAEALQSPKPTSPVHTSNVPQIDPTKPSALSAVPSAATPSKVADEGDIATQSEMTEAKSPAQPTQPTAPPDDPTIAPKGNKAPATVHPIQSAKVPQQQPIEEQLLNEVEVPQDVKPTPAVETSGPFIEQVTSPNLTQQQQHYADEYLKSLTTRTNVLYVRINASLLAKETFTINLPKQNITVRTKERTDRLGGRVSWVGETETPFGQVSFVVNGSMVTGSFRIPDMYYRIIPLGEGLHLLIPYDDIKAYKCGSMLHRMPIKEAEDRVMSELDPVPGAKAMAGSCRIRLMIAFTAQVESAAADIQSTIQNQVDDYNLANANSSVTSRVELARSYRTSYVESGAQATHPDHSNWTTVPLDLFRVQNSADGYMDDIPTQRDLYDADMTCLLVTDCAGWGGYAYDYGPISSKSYCIALWNNGIPQTTAHEFGHLITFHHDTYVDPTGYTNYVYEHGYYRTGTGTKFRTIMAYSNACSDAGVSCPVIDNWSNPNITYDGYATGTTASHNNALAYNNRDATIASHQAKILYKTIWQNDVVRDNEEAHVEGGLTASSAYYSVQYNSGSIGSYIAQDSVILKPGFNAKIGSTFHAFLDNCTDISLMDTPVAAAERDLDDAPVLYDLAHLDMSALSIMAYPNPAREITTLQFSIPTSEPMSIKIFDMHGKAVQTPLSAPDIAPGIHQIDVPLHELPAGIYTCALQSGKNTTQTRIIVQR
jgi:hypothetical protein